LHNAHNVCKVSNGRTRRIFWHYCRIDKPGLFSWNIWLQIPFLNFTWIRAGELEYFTTLCVRTILVCRSSTECSYSMLTHAYVRTYTYSWVVTHNFIRKFSYESNTKQTNWSETSKRKHFQSEIGAPCSSHSWYRKGIIPSCMRLRSAHWHVITPLSLSQNRILPKNIAEFIQISVNVKNI
jgi:hypothetical protein